MTLVTWTKWCLLSPLFLICTFLLLFFKKDISAGFPLPPSQCSWGRLCLTGKENMCAQPVTRGLKIIRHADMVWQCVFATKQPVLTLSVDAGMAPPVTKLLLEGRQELRERGSSVLLRMKNGSFFSPSSSAANVPHQITIVIKIKRKRVSRPPLKCSAVAKTPCLF